jgi:hypothetical protein
LRRFPSFGAAPLAVSGFIPFGELLAVFREGEEEAVSTSLENALWCRAALPAAKNIIYLNQRLDRTLGPLEGEF